LGRIQKGVVASLLASGGILIGFYSAWMVAMTDKPQSLNNRVQEMLPTVGQTIKVCLPGETPYAICVEMRDESWMGCIINKLFREYSEHEQAQWLGKEWGKGFVKLPEHHQYKKFDVIEFVLADYKYRDGAGWEPKKL
jgi:hypothetical protein